MERIGSVAGETFSVIGKKLMASKKKVEGLVMEAESSNPMKLLIV